MPKTVTEIAKIAVENYIKNGRIINPPSDVSKELKNKKAGVFVTIEKKECSSISAGKKDKRILRGCIGTYLPTKKNIIEEIIQNAISAATDDYRFGPVKEEELPYLSYVVYVLRKPQKTLSISDLNPKKYGILVKSKLNPRKRGLLLPDIEGIKTISEQIFYACQKGGIILGKEPIEIFRFEAEKYE